MNTAELDALKIVIYDYANSGKANGQKKSRWDCLQFASRAIDGNGVPREVIEYISQLYHQTNLIKS